jgi:pimeloyl-ACP methyl ester carboxylesterase
MSTVRTYPGAQRPDRRYFVDSNGLKIAVYEWGDEAHRPLFLVHGGLDFAGTYDTFAPLLAAGGWRVISYDHRGLGDSDHADLYTWEGELRDLVTVMDHITSAPMPVIGHSRGGAKLLQVADAAPYRVSRFVNIDGMPSKRKMPDIPDHDQSKIMSGEVTKWLDNRRTVHNAIRKPGTIEELAQRRGKTNPRLSLEWLEYLVTIGAYESEDGWRWKLDPAIRMGGFGPHRPEWMLAQMSALGVPFLGLIGTEDEPMGWGSRPRDIEPWLPEHGRLEVVDDVGHFVHIEKLDVVANMVLEFLQ